MKQYVATLGEFVNGNHFQASARHPSGRRIALLPLKCAFGALLVAAIMPVQGRADPILNPLIDEGAVSVGTSASMNQNSGRIGGKVLVGIGSSTNSSDGGGGAITGGVDDSGLPLASNLFQSLADPPLAGHQGFNTFSATATNTGDAATATTFSIPNFTSTGVQDGNFAGMPSQNFGTVTLNTLNPTAFTLSSSLFGTFTGISIFSDSTSPAGRLIGLLGSFTPGTYPISQGAPPGTVLSDLNFAFSQVSAGGPIQAGATFAAPTSVPSVPDGGMTLMLLGGALVGLESLRRRFRV